ncbi:hypothetical protein [Chromobacterium sphagni]|uniref:hypothetical protein n=1 Tax=Chromobacterium sphagni TaxID=1903179 RepID=UPI0011144398|nr:hypothetical protein [Chromobacterium sphagni]
MSKLKSILPVTPTSPATTASKSAYDAYFCQAVQAALDDTDPGIRHEKVKHDFASKRASLLTRQALD